MNIQKQRFTIIVSVLIAFFIGLSIFNLKYRTKEATGEVIAQDILKLKQIFVSIDQDCKILGFDYQKNPINFLNVGSFAGSEVGPMNLTYPDRWKGPYLDNNLTVQDQEYQVVYTKKGYFITPGDGVKLPNGKVIGKDILLDEDANIAALTCENNDFMFDGSALAAELKLGQVDASRVVVDPEDME